MFLDRILLTQQRIKRRLFTNEKRESQSITKSKKQAEVWAHPLKIELAIDCLLV